MKPGWLQPTVDTVTYSDGLSEEVNGFDVPVPALGEEFDLALIGKKGTWYDHKVRVENPVSGEAEDAEAASSETENSVMRQVPRNRQGRLQMWQTALIPVR